MLAELRRLTDRPNLGPGDLPALLRRIELRPSDTHLLVDRAALIGDEHPELAIQDIYRRLRENERLVHEDGTTLRLALPPAA